MKFVATIILSLAMAVPAMAEQVVVYDPGTDRVTYAHPRANTADYAGNPNTLISTIPASEISGFTALWGAVPVRNWMHDSGGVREMTQAEKDARDAEDAAAQLASVRSGAPETWLGLGSSQMAQRALILLILDEFNDHTATINAILDAADNATSLATFKTAMAAISDQPVRTAAQLRNAIETRISSGGADADL
jgi:hypothetical protein